MTTNTTEAPQVPSSLLTRIEAADYLQISLDGLDRLIHRSDHPLLAPAHAAFCLFF
jgi:hypothetical protein